MFYGRRNGRNFAASSLTPAATPLGLGISLEPIQLICNFLISSRNHVAELMLLGKLKSERSICYVYRVLHWQSGILDSREPAYARARAGAPRSRVPQIFPLFFFFDTEECMYKTLWGRRNREAIVGEKEQRI